MNRFWILGLAAALSVTPAFAAPPKPAVEIRLKAAAELVPVLEYGGNLVGQGEVTKQFGGIIKTFVDNEKGFFGLDLKKPIGAYISVGEKIEDSTFALMLPVVDETTSLDALKNNLGLELKKGEGGIYSADVPNVPGTVYVAFDEGYAYLTIRSESSVQKANRISPKDFFPAKAESILGVKLFPDRVPADVRKYLVGQVEMQLRPVRARSSRNS